MAQSKSAWGWFGAACVILLGVAVAVPTAQWVKRSEGVVGVAGHTTYQPSSASKTSGTYTVYVTFQTRGGQWKTVGMKAFSRKSYPEGPPVPVLYNTYQPRDARLDNWLDLWLWPTILLTWGLIWMFRMWGVGRTR